MLVTQIDQHPALFTQQGLRADILKGRITLGIHFKGDHIAGFQRRIVGLQEYPIFPVEIEPDKQASRKGHLVVHILWIPRYEYGISSPQRLLNLLVPVPV
ncbi:MAG: hypothetical protein D4R67_09875 [Bacteroidetes bacterium]|nr:MAG: hypothetical protein D4R67_09875 [Bacteroidota bacterium]